MRTIFREWFLYLLSVYVLNRLFAFVSVANEHVLIIGATALFLLNTIGQPILKVLWLPINIITLGLFSWMLNILVILIVVFFIPGFELSPFTSPSIQIGRILIPAIHLKMFWTYFFFSFILAWSVGFLRWLFVEE